MIIQIVLRAIRLGFFFRQKQQEQKKTASTRLFSKQSVSEIWI